MTQQGSARGMVIGGAALLVAIAAAVVSSLVVGWRGASIAVVLLGLVATWAVLLSGSAVALRARRRATVATSAPRRRA